MGRFKFFASILLCAVLTSSSPVGHQSSSYQRTILGHDDKDQLFGDDTILDHIVKVNKGNDVNKYEADIVLSPDDNVDLSNDGDVDGSGIGLRKKRNAARDRKKLWVTRVIPYKYDSGLPDSFKSTIQEAMAEFENKTCLKFVQRSSEALFINIIHKPGCWSSVGRQYWMSGVGQRLSLGSGCNHKGTIMHELMHAAGFWHEQSRPDRNLYVEVLWENIEPDDAYNFNKYSHRDIDRLKVPYDFDSIMHYGRKSFSKNGKETIRSILDPNRPLGQRNGFTEFDVHEINSLYDCAASGSWSTWSEFGPCSTKCKKTRQRFCSSSDVAKDCPGADQYGVQQEQVKCTDKECFAPIDGHWGRWSSWGLCSTECGFGTQTRTRSCDDPPPRYGGKQCAGSSKDSQACKQKSCGIGPYDCEFDFDGICHWKIDDSNPSGFTWERNSGRTPSSSTGPSTDHTSGPGHYLYAETSGIARGDKAQLVSRTFPATTGRCMTFWYHMYGSGMGELNVYVNITGTKLKVWSMSGDQGDEWKMARVTLVSKSFQYQVIFEAVRGSSFRSDIALDDISFKGYPCLEAVGCYLDKVSARALPSLVKNFRGHIDWYHIDKTIADCAKEVQNQGFEVFGVQFYGECWSASGKPNETEYNKYGVAPPEDCWEGVGKHSTNFVYKIV
ncbi:uncharacterized protein LOC111330143 [Stylophora pistillata]|uniref:uncharacterized protein LOC111330143 n=1 Tax=Stylophora pistillata TaxID=50429 RepID=UPI000C04D63B|nr:uncharacterized protein LOC111330143 [Stylophora pistillata]